MVEAEDAGNNDDDDDNDTSNNDVFNLSNKTFSIWQTIKLGKLQQK